MKKTCKICQMMIDTNLERHGVFKDMNGKKEVSKGYYHFECFMERIQSKNSNKQLQEKACGLLDKMGMKVEEVIN